MIGTSLAGNGPLWMWYAWHRRLAYDVAKALHAKVPTLVTSEDLKAIDRFQEPSEEWWLHECPDAMEWVRPTFREDYLRE